MKTDYTRCLFGFNGFESLEDRRYESRILDEQTTILCFYVFVVSSERRKISGLLCGVAKSQQSNDDHVLSVLDFGHHSVTDESPGLLA